MSTVCGEKGAKREKVFSMLFAVVMLLSLCPLTFAAEDEVNTGFNEKTILQAIEEYFVDRNLILDGAQNIDDYPGLFTLDDEIEHKSVLNANGFSVAASKARVIDLWVSDNRAVAQVEENVQYRKDGRSIDEMVLHTIYLYPTDDMGIVVGADEYKEVTTGFKSCSYVDETADVSPMAAGSKYCIVNIAKNEVGYTAGSNNYTKYGAWFATGYANSDWCAMFVCWCANQANVSTSVISRDKSVAVVDNLKEFFKDKKQFYSKGSATPRAGDIYFEGVSTSNLKHTAIIESVSNGKMYIIEGNAGSSPTKVQRRTVSLTASNYVGFARPSYGTTSHTFKTVTNGSGTVLYYLCTACGFKSTTQTGTQALQLTH